MTEEEKAALAEKEKAEKAAQGAASGSESDAAKLLEVKKSLE